MQTSHPQNWTSRTSRMLTTPQHLPKPPKSWALRLDVKASATSGGFLGVRVLHKIRQIIRKIYSSFARILFLQKCEFSPNPETSSFSKQQVFVCGTFMYIPYKYIRRPESAWHGNILCRIQTMSSKASSKPKSKIQTPKSKLQNPNGAVWGRHKKNEY